MNAQLSQKLQMPDAREKTTEGPRIERVLDLTAGDHDRLTPGGPFCIAGRGFGSFGEVPNDVGVYVHCSTRNHLVRVHQYVSWGDEEIRGHWPMDVLGPMWLFLEMRAEDGLIRSAVHAHPLRLRV